MKYTVHFTNESGDTVIGNSEFVTAENPTDAAKKFLENKKEVHPYCFVVWGWGKNELVTLTEVIKERELKKRNEEFQALNERLRLLQDEAEQIKNISFLELSAEKRDELYNVVSYLSSDLEVRALEKEEIEFLKAWHQLKDKELGEALLTKNEMSKPKSEQGKSAFSKTAWAAGFAMQGLATQNALNDIADDVSDISDGGGGFD